MGREALIEEGDYVRWRCGIWKVLGGAVPSPWIRGRWVRGSRPATAGVIQGIPMSEAEKLCPLEVLALMGFDEIVP